MHCFVVPIRDDDGNDLPGVTTSDCHYKGGLPGRGQRPHHVRPRPGPAREPAQQVRRRRRRTAHTPRRSRTPNRRFFTMLGTLIRGRVTVGGSAARRRPGGARHRDPICVAAQAVRRARRRRRSADHGLPGAPAPAAPADREVLRAAVRAERAGGQMPRAADLRRPRPRGAARAGVPGRRAEGRQHLARHTRHSGGPRSLRRRRLSGREPADRAARPTPTCSPPSRATTMC